MKFPYGLLRAFYSACLGCALATSAFAANLGLIGEDVPFEEGLVVTVNSIVRQPFSGGLNAQQKFDLFEASVTIVNTGRRPMTIDPQQEFILQIAQPYQVQVEKGKACLDKVFTVHPGTNSRGSLFFRVKSDDTRESARLLFRRGGNELKIILDEAMGKLLEKSRSTALDLDDTLKAGQFLVDAGRLSDAEKILKGGYTRFGDDARLLLLLVATARSQGNLDQASQYLSRINPDGSLGREDALTLARQAYDLEQYEIARKVLEPLAEKGILEDKDLLFLGRCWYFDKQHDRADKLLRDLAARGMQQPQLFFTLGNIAEKREEWTAAVDWWQKTMDLDPKHYEALFNIGVGCYKQDQKDRAVACWKRVLELDPDSETRQIVEDTLKQMQR